jgi:hypothetical protein
VLLLSDIGQYLKGNFKSIDIHAVKITVLISDYNVGGTTVVALQLLQNLLDFIPVTLY